MEMTSLYRPLAVLRADSRSPPSSPTEWTLIPIALRNLVRLLSAEEEKDRGGWSALEALLRRGVCSLVIAMEGGLELSKSRREDRKEIERI
jgi:hypothetical protein